jgi:excisionase family DNA binding protein
MRQPVKEYTSMKKENYITVPVMTVSEAARFIGVGKKVIYQLIEFDEIRAVRERGKVLIDRSSLEAFHNSGKRP